MISEKQKLSRRWVIREQHWEEATIRTDGHGTVRALNGWLIGGAVLQLLTAWCLPRYCQRTAILFRWRMRCGVADRKRWRSFAVTGVGRRRCGRGRLRWSSVDILMRSRPPCAHTQTGGCRPFGQASSRPTDCSATAQAVRRIAASGSSLGIW